jgi:hypothetical protein
MKRVEYDVRNAEAPSSDVQTKEKGREAEDIIRPADYFDMMAGTDFGG